MPGLVKVVGSATQPRLNAYDSFPTATACTLQEFCFSLYPFMKTLLHRRVKVITVISTLLHLNIPESTGYSSLVSPEIIHRANKNAYEGVDVDAVCLGWC